MVQTKTTLAEYRTSKSVDLPGGMGLSHRDFAIMRTALPGLPIGKNVPSELNTFHPQRPNHR